MSNLPGRRLKAEHDCKHETCCAAGLKACSSHGRPASVYVCPAGFRAACCPCRDDKHFGHHKIGGHDAERDGNQQWTRLQRQQLGDVAGSTRGAQEFCTSKISSSEWGHAPCATYTSPRRQRSYFHTISTNGLNLLLMLQVNAVRLFLTPRTDLQEMVGATFGRDLNGAVVSTQARYLAAIKVLRTPKGHDPSASWPNPILWSQYER